ncbi:MAG: ABC transporter substrate binding protein, partial [Lacunisphaera sp.]
MFFLGLMVFAWTAPAMRAQVAAKPLPPCPDVLIINSYSAGYEWSEDALGGIIKTLREHYSDVEPVIQHLDTKRFPIEKREAAILADLVEKNRLRPPRLIITMDDAAFDFIRKYRSQLGGAAMPVVFGGVNHFVPEMLAGQPNITGVSEESDFQGTFDLIRRLTPHTKKILVINTRSESGRASRQALEENLTAAQSGYEFEFYEDWTDEQLIDRVTTLPKDTVGFLLDTAQDVTGRGNYNNLAFTSALSTRSSVPLFINSRPPGQNDWSVSPWLGLGGGMVVASVHGEKVGELAARVLAVERADAIPVVRRSPTVMEVDYRQMRRFGFSLDLLPRGTRVINAPVNFYQINRSRIIWVAVVFVILCAVIIAMFINILLRRRAERA